MSDLTIVAFDIVAIIVLSYGIYFRRHRRKDMLLAYVGLNIGVMVLTMALISASIGAGLGLGLFGVLSIIRLRSAEMSQHEIAYYFAALVLGLLMGANPDPTWMAPVLGSLVVAAMYIADHPDLLAGNRHQVVTLDAAYTSEQQLVDRLEELLDAEVQRVIVNRIDLVRDVTTVDVRYRLRSSERAFPLSSAATR